MSDIAVVLPQSFGLSAWCQEGQLPGEPWNGEEYHFYLWGVMPRIKPGERVYVFYKGHLIGYAPLVRIDRHPGRCYSLVRRDGAVAVTIPERVKSWRGFRYRWWERAQEVPFPAWMALDSKGERL